MSVSYHIACLKCKEYLWIGQSSECLYSGEPHTMEALRQFLFKHCTYDPHDKKNYHELVFIPEPFNGAWESRWEGEEWKEIDVMITS